MNGCDCVIEPADSPWASLLVPVKKKNGAVRWACDFHVLNSLTVDDSFPTPNISEVLETLSESKVFSTLDAQNAYHCISIEEKSRPLTAFTMAADSIKYRLATLNNRQILFFGNKIIYNIKIGFKFV